MLAALALVPALLLGLAAGAHASRVTSPGAAPAGDDESDVVQLRDGTEQRGRVVLRDYDRVVLVQGSRTREIPREEVAAVDAIAATLTLLAKRVDAAEAEECAAESG